MCCCVVLPPQEFARIAEVYGDRTARLTCEENILFVNVPNDKLPAMLAEPIFQKFKVNPGKDNGSGCKAWYPKHLDCGLMKNAPRHCGSGFNLKECGQYHPTSRAGSALIAVNGRSLITTRPSWKSANFYQPPTPATPPALQATWSVAS